MERLGGRVKLKKPVVRIDQSGENVVVETLDHELYEVMKHLTSKQPFLFGQLENFSFPLWLLQNPVEKYNRDWNNYDRRSRFLIVPA